MGTAPATDPAAAAPPESPGPAASGTGRSTTSSMRIPAFVARGPAPARLGPFTLGQPLDSSVLGRTFRATRADDGASVVLKLVERDEPGLREHVARLLGTLEEAPHPGLARVVGRGEDQGFHYYALDVPASVTLIDFVRRGRPLDGAEVSWIGAHLCAALASLHGREIAHGDVTPANVAITGDGTPLLVDLGWAPRVRDPELGSKLAEAKSQDVAQLAATLVFATTGQAVKARPSGRFARPLTDPSAKPKPLQERAAWLTPKVATLLDTLMGEPDRRPTAAEAEALFRAAGEEAGLQPGGAPPDLFDTARSLAGGGGASDTTVGGAAGGGKPGAAAPALGAFGRYVLVEEIARGGMGVVYRARHAELGRVFALKVLLSGDLANDLARRRFLREAEAASLLDHPSIVRVHDFGEHEGRAYIAMDFAEGRPLSALISEPAQELEGLLGLFTRVCDGVHYAHARGIIHRDLKPQNVVVDAARVPRILDFGVAKRLDEGARPGQAGAGLTTEGELVGTPAYMPPEQAEGRSRDIDTRSDVYALGVILYELSSRGRLPFEGLTVTDVLTKVLLDDPKAPSTHAPGLPWEIDAITLKAIEKDPRKRYQSAAELAEDVRRFLEGLPIQARRATALYRAHKWALRNRRALPFVGIAAAALALVPIGIARQAAEDRARRRAEVAELVAQGDAGVVANEPQRLKEAQKAYAAALKLDPTSTTATAGSTRAEMLLRRLEDLRDAARRETEIDGFKREEAARFVQKGEELLRKGEAERSLEAFYQALAFDPSSEPARRGLTAANRIEFARKAEEDERTLRERNAREAQRLVNEGSAALAARDAEAARGAFFQALGFDKGNAEAREGLRAADHLADEAEAARVREQRLAESRTLVERGKSRLAARDVAGARDDFTRALAFDGTSAEALQGISTLDRLGVELAADLERKKRRAEAEQLVTQGREKLAEGRELARQGGDRTAVRSVYYEAIEAFDRATFLVPGDEAFASEKKGAARELAGLAKNQQEWGLSQYLYRIAGVAADAGTDSSPAEATEGCVVVRESDAILMQRAFREPLAFEEEETLAYLAPVRALVEPKKDRFKLTLEVRSRVASGQTPTIYVTALVLRLEDLKRKVLGPPEKIELDPSAFQRMVIAGTSGRVVPSLKKSLQNSADEVLGRLKERVTQMIADAEKKP